jgi:hypothetical protein
VANGHGQVDLSGLVALVDTPTQQNLELAGRAGFYQAQLAAEDEQIRALMAPEEPAPAAPRWLDEPAPVDPPRPWWRFW